MWRIVGVLGVAVAAVAVTVPVGLADDGGTKTEKSKDKSAVRCARAGFGGKIERVGDDALGVRAAISESGKVLVLRLTGDTVIKQGGGVVDRTALEVGKMGRFYVRACHRDERFLITAKLILLRDGNDGPSGEPPAKEDPPVKVEKPGATEPKPAEDVCYTGEANVKIVGISDSSITILKTSNEGTKELKVTVNGDTVVRKSDEAVSLGALNVGDYVNLNIVYCKSGSVRAVRIVFLRA
jgi:hypothetical protein